MILNRKALCKGMSIDETIDSLKFFCNNVVLTDPELNDRLDITTANAVNYLFMYKQAMWQNDAVKEEIAKKKENKRYCDADELLEHVWRERLDTRERIADLVERMVIK